MVRTVDSADDSDGAANAANDSSGGSRALLAETSSSMNETRGQPASTGSGTALDMLGETRVLTEDSAPSVVALVEPKLEESGLEQGDFVGRYSVLSRLGHGGMGVVYKAYDPQLDRNVALKLLRASRSSSESGLRLLREARTLAKLRHPNVVDVYDAGMTEHGVFIAMELLEGRTLRQWLRVRPRTVSEILRVFRLSGRGLVAAHEAGFVHRDFKPSNIFIDDADGSVRVLDFGLAHHVQDPSSTQSPGDALGREAIVDSLPSVMLAANTGEVFSTEAGTVLGTPAYMAPEQFMEGRSDRGSEQFAFAMSLYVSLYDRTPPGSESYESRKACVEEGRLLDVVALERSATGERVPRRVRRVMLRALSRDPALRFTSMQEMLALLEEPRRRHKEALAALTLILGFGAGAVLFSQDQPTPQCSSSTTVLEGAWDEADHEALSESFARMDRSESSQVIEQQLDDYAAAWVDMYEQSCRATFVEQTQSEQMFDQRMRCLERRRNRLRATVDSLVESQTVQELMSRTILPHRLPSIEPCGDLELLMAEHPPPETEEQRRQVSALREQIDESKTYLDSGDYQRGIGLAQEILPEAEALGYRPLLAETLAVLGRLQADGGDAVDAEQTLRRAIEVGAEVRDLHTVASAWTTLLFALTRQNRLDEGLTLELSARASVVMVDDRVLQAWLLNNLAFLYSQRGERDTSREYLYSALELKQAALGADHVDVGISWFNLGATLVEDQQTEEAERAFRRSVEIFGATVGAGHPLSHFAQSGLCQVEQERGHAEAAVSLCSAVLEQFDRLPPSPMWVSRVSFTLAKAFRQLGDTQAATKNALRAQEAIAHEDPQEARQIGQWLAQPDGAVQGAGIDP